MQFIMKQNMLAQNLTRMFSIQNMYQPSESSLMQIQELEQRKEYCMRSKYDN